MKTPADIAQRVLGGDLRAAARLMRLVDDGVEDGLLALGEVYKRSRPARSVGVTGSPGTGKSTLIDRLISAYRARGERVGVIAVDPSSALSGGAILGDRLRMQEHALDPGVFVRSLASRGVLGGVSLSTAATLAVFEGLGFERVIVETVGVGQAEVDVARLVEATLVVLAPGLGDDVQALKAGVMEIADLFVVNKSDREGADRTAHEVEAVLRLRPPPSADAEQGPSEPPVLLTSAARGEGIAELLAAIDAFFARLDPSPELARRRRARARLELETMLLAELRLGLAASGPALAEAEQRLAARSSDPSTECRRLLAARGARG
jgi:LAO/AO transport system kinase